MRYDIFSIANLEYLEYDTISKIHIKVTRYLPEIQFESLIIIYKEFQILELKVQLFLTKNM